MQREKAIAEQKRREKEKSKIDKVAVMMNVHNADVTDRYGGLTPAMKLSITDNSTLMYKGPGAQPAEKFVIDPDDDWWKEKVRN